MFRHCTGGITPNNIMSHPSHEHGAQEEQFRSIQELKKKVDKESAHYKVLCRAEEIAASAEFVGKKEATRKYLISVGLLDDEFEARLEEMSIDMAEREDERAKDGDMMQFERAGLPLEEQALVKKLDETNNLCYKYLRENGSKWQYDPSKIHPCMKARLYRRFDTFDRDLDGTMTIAEVLTWADRMRTICDTNDEEVEKIRESLGWYFTMYGLGDEGLCRHNWVEAHVTMGEAAMVRERKGEIIPMVVLANNYFDVIDADDDGRLSMPELKNMMNVFKVPEEAAYTFFEAADVGKDGELDKEEMHKLFYKFWFGKYDHHLDGIFAYKY